MSRRRVGDIGLALFALLMFALLWVTPYAAVTDYRSGEKDPSKRWVLLKRVTTETPRWDWGKFPPLSFDYGFPIGYKQFQVYVQDPKYRARVIENALIAAGGVLALFGGFASFLYFTGRSTQHGDARFGSLAEADDARLFAKSGLILGKLGGQNLVSNDAAHVLVVGPTRSGKGVSFVVPNGLTWRGSMVVLDIKMENFAKFGQARFAAGDAVFVFAPGSTKSHRYNPLDFVRPGPEMATDCANIAGFLCGGGIVRTNGPWPRERLWAHCSATSSPARISRDSATSGRRCG